MASTINADNGVSSGSAGLKSAADSSGVLSLQTNGTTAVTVDTSQNVGIGTSSPRGTLDVTGTTGVTWTGAVNGFKGLATIGTQGTSGGSLVVNTSGLNSGYGAGFAVDGTYSNPGGVGTAVIRLQALGVYSGGGYDSAMSFWTSLGTTATEKMRLDSSGNLGLGVTPSAWGSDTRALQIFNRTSLSDLQSTTQLTNNGIWNGTNWVYRETAAAGNYNINSGAHIWRTAPSGTAGNAISFTQAMTLDSSGNLLVGTTSAAGARLNVNGDVQQRGTNGRITQAVKGIGSAVSSITVDVGGGLDGTSYFVEISLSGYQGVYLRYIHTVYKTNSWTDYSPSVVQNLASLGVSVAYSSPSAGVLRYTITASVTYPVVQVKVTSGGTTVDAPTTISIS